MTRTMYDSVNWAAIPANAQMVAGYLAPSSFAWPAAAWARFPNAVKVQIAVRASTNAGQVLDVESGDATPAQAPGWVAMRRAANPPVDPTVYCSASAWPTVQAAFASAGLAQPHYWIASYPGGGAVIPSGAVAHQYADPNSGSGGDWDLSVVADYWPGVDPISTPVLPPVLPVGEDMPSRVCNPGTNEHADMSVVGCTQLSLCCSYSQTITVYDLLFFGDTPAEPAPAANGVGGGYASEDHAGATWTIDPNRAGPISIPAGARSVTLRYDAGHDFFMSAQ